ncbi:MAG: transposase, partial [Microvirga sp.]|nr:transposase [Microvirga sp.]
MPTPTRPCGLRAVLNSTEGTLQTFQRAEMENLLKAHKRHLASDRTSCTRACANQVRLFLHGAAYWLLWTFQSLMPKRSPWR